MREKYSWPRLPKTVRSYMRSCRECQRWKTPPTRPGRLLRPIRSPTKLFQQIGMDLRASYPVLFTCNWCIVVATKYLTRSVETKVLPCGTTKEMAKFFTESFCITTVLLNWSWLTEDSFHKPPNARSYVPESHVASQNNGVPPTNKWAHRTT